MNAALAGAIFVVVFCFFQVYFLNLGHFGHGLFPQAVFDRAGRGCRVLLLASNSWSCSTPPVCLSDLN